MRRESGKMAKRLTRAVRHLRLFSTTSLKSRFYRVTRQNTPWFKRLLPTLPKLRLSHQLLGFFVLIVLFPLLLLSFSIYSINQKAVKKQVAHFTERSAQATYDELLLETQWQKQQARLVAQYWLDMASRQSRTPQAAKIRQFFKDYPEYEAIAFYDRTGKRTAYYHVYNRPNPIVSLPERLRQLPAQIDFELSSTPAAGGKTLNYRLEIAVPGELLDARPTTGAVVFRKKFPFMQALVSERFNSFEQGFVVVDEDGIIIAGPRQLVGQKIAATDQTRYQALTSGIIKSMTTEVPMYGLTVRDNDDNQDAIKLEKVFIKLSHPRWGLIMETPYRIQRQYVLIARTQSVGLVFLCILIIVVLGTLYSSGINRNFRQLIKGIKALSEGNYSRKIRLITKTWTPFEIIYLTAEFNRMAAKIAHAWADIQTLNRELVNKNQQDLFVARLTQELHNTLELEIVCRTATRILAESPEIAGCRLYLLTEAENQALSLASESVSGEPEANAFASLPEPDLHRVLCSREPLPPAGNGTASIHPVCYQETPLGLLVLVRRADISEPQPAMLNVPLLMDLVCRQIGVAIYQARQWEQLQQANAQLSKLDELKSNLIDTVSHELRTPLTNIKGYTSRLLRYEDTLDPEIRMKSLKVIKQQADRLGRLVEDLLVIPELEREEGIRVYPDRVNLSELIHRCVSFMEEKAGRDIRVTHCPDDLDILADPDRMEQVLLNLLDNAIKYAYEDAEIEVTVLPPGETTVEIQVYNPCDPISPEALAQLFTKFKRLDERLTRTTRGTGLGLFITRGLVEAMGGKIRLSGDNGFRVMIEIPLYQPQAKADESVEPVSA